MYRPKDAALPQLAATKPMAGQRTNADEPESVVWALGANSPVDIAAYLASYQDIVFVWLRRRRQTDLKRCESMTVILGPAYLRIVHR
jgi:hypothetical protein